MESMTWGVIPENLPDEPFPMELNQSDLTSFAAIVNQGIDSHLEAVFCTQEQRGNKSRVVIRDASSMRCFLRRCAESEDENARELAGSIVEVLGFEWI